MKAFAYNARFQPATIMGKSQSGIICFFVALPMGFFILVVPLLPVKIFFGVVAVLLTGWGIFLFIMDDDIVFFKVMQASWLEQRKTIDWRGNH